MKAILILGLMAVLAGCGGRPGGLADAMKYTPTVHHVQMEDDTYRIFEHPDDNKLMTTPSLGKSAGAGFVQGATLGLAQALPHEQRHEAAARRHLDNTGRQNCRIVSGYEILKGQYEFTFDCSSQSSEEAGPVS